MRLAKSWKNVARSYRKLLSAANQCVSMSIPAIAAVQRCGVEKGASEAGDDASAIVCVASKDSECGDFMLYVIHV
jgi:hypothetical protein